MIVTLTKELKKLINTYGAQPRVEHWIYLPIGDTSRSVRIPMDAREQIHEYYKQGPPYLPAKFVRFIIEMEQDTATLVGMEFLGWVDQPFKKDEESV